MFYRKRPSQLWNLFFFFFFFFVVALLPLRCLLFFEVSSFFLSCPCSPPPPLPHFPHANPHRHAAPRGPLPLRAPRAARNAQVSTAINAELCWQKFPVLPLLRLPTRVSRRWWELSARQLRYQKQMPTRWRPKWISNAGSKFLLCSPCFRYSWLCGQALLFWLQSSGDETLWCSEESEVWLQGSRREEKKLLSVIQISPVSEKISCLLSAPFWPHCFYQQTLWSESCLTRTSSAVYISLSASFFWVPFLSFLL